MEKEQDSLKDGWLPLPVRVERLEDRTDDQDSRLDTLERDKAYLLGIGAAIGFLTFITLGLLTIWASWK